MIDAHMHVKFRGFEPADIIAYLDKYKCEKCWLLSWEEMSPVIPKNYMHLSIEDVYNAYEQYPSRIVPMYAPDPARPDFEERLASWSKKGVRGCGELKVSMDWSSGRIEKLLLCLDKMNMPLLFHMQETKDIYAPASQGSFEKILSKLLSSEKYGGISRKTVELIAGFIPPLNAAKEKMRQRFPGYLLDFMTLEKRLIEYPQITFIGHGPFFWKGISGDWRKDPSVYPKSPVTEDGIVDHLLSEYDNFYADISGESGFNALNRDTGYAKKFLSKHYRKILYGTDNFELGLQPLLESLSLSSKAYEHIYSGNALSIVE